MGVEGSRLGVDEGEDEERGVNCGYARVVELAEGFESNLCLRHPIATAGCVGSLGGRRV